MKAMIWTKYGPPDVLQLREVDKPIPRDNEVLVKVHAASAFSGDCELRRFHIIPSGWLFLRLYIGVIKPKRITILGQEMAGVIEAVGKDVTLFREGDQVFGISGMRMGTYAEYVCISGNTPMAIKPKNITFEEAAVISAGGLEALHFYQKAKARKGQKILINGAKMSGAEVTCVDSSIKLDMLKALGADEAIDYTKDDFTKNVDAYDVIFDLVGKFSFSRTMRSLKKNGVLVLGNSGFITSKLFGIWAAISSNKRAISNLETGTKVDLEYLKNIIASEKIKVVIDKRFPLERTADAHRYIEQGLKKGNVVIIVIDDRPDPGNE
jgi:NADPH:quinone reductase-like Zn-dependent oxidoreductase